MEGKGVGPFRLGQSVCQRPGELILGCHRGTGSFNQFPKSRILFQFLVIRKREAGAVFEVFKGVFAKDAVDDDTQLVAFEVDAIIAESETVEGAAATFEFSEFLQIGAEHLLGKPSKLTEDIELEVPGKFFQVSGAGWVKDDLELTHRREILWGAEGKGASGK